MSNIWFCSDLHLGHKNIGKFRAPLVNSTEENNTRILKDLKKYVDKRDHLWVLGDWCFDMALVEEFADIKCERKLLVRGNHDNFNMDVYNKVFNAVYGIVSYKHMWLTHAPVHADELRKRPNVHGHVHYESIRKAFNPLTDVKQELDARYFNCCPENLWPKYGRCLVSLDELRQHFST